MGRCETDGIFVVAVHGGAVLSRNDQRRKVAFMQQALPQARAGEVG